MRLTSDIGTYIFLNYTVLLSQTSCSTDALASAVDCYPMREYDRLSFMYSLSRYPMFCINDNIIVNVSLGFYCEFVNSFFDGHIFLVGYPISRSHFCAFCALPPRTSFSRLQKNGALAKSLLQERHFVLISDRANRFAFYHTGRQQNMSRRILAVLDGRKEQFNCCRRHFFLCRSNGSQIKRKR